MKNKRGISPIIATVLLIVMVIVIALIIFLWFRGIMVEKCEKFDKACELTCNDVQFDSSYSNGFLYISNIGNVPIFSIKVKMLSEGSHETSDIKDLSSTWSSTGLNQGGVFSDSVSIGGAEKIIVIPVLIGSSDEGKKTYICEQYGQEIVV